MHSEPESQTQPMGVDQFDLSFIPRGCHLKVIEAARRRNTIAVVDKAAGKPMIAVMTIKATIQAMKLNGDGDKLIIFLAPTKTLVHQQYEVINLQKELEVGEYYGDIGDNKWDAKTWRSKVGQHHVLFMTPESLLDALRSSSLSIDSVFLIVLDECLHATNNHPCRKIVKEFYNKCTNKPKIFGITAEPVIRKGVSSMKDREEQIMEMVSLLDSLIFSVDDNSELEEFISSSKEIFIFYHPAVSQTMEVKGKLESCWLKYRDADRRHEMLQKRLSSDHSRILWCLENLGVMCAYEAVKICIEDAADMKEESDTSLKRSLHRCFLEEVQSLTGKLFPEEEGELLSDGYISSQYVALGYITPKLHELLDIFKSFGRVGEVSCLILVERIITAKVIPRVMKKLNCLSHLDVTCMAETNLSNDAFMQKDNFKAFRVGMVNLLFTTNMDEEMIDVLDCSLVIRFDLPKTALSYVRSPQQKDLNYLTFLERGNMRQREHLFNIIRSEYSTMNNKANTLGTGTTKRKELHGTTRIHALSARWGDNWNYTNFSAYRIDFSCNIAEEHFSSFILLLNSNLDDDVGNIDVGLNLISKFVKASVSSYGKMYLDAEQVKKAKRFHELFFNGIFGRLFVKSSGDRKFLLQEGESLWGPSYMYLLLPLNNECNSKCGSWRIDWMGIESCVSAVEFLKINALLNVEQPKSVLGKPSLQGSNSAAPDFRDSDIIHFANTSVCKNDVKEMVVASIHTGKIYSILDAVDNMSADSTFDGYDEAKPSSYKTFAEYFLKQYGIFLLHLEQPLMLLKQSHNAHNLLLDLRNGGDASEKNSDSDILMKPQAHIHMPPELLVRVDVRQEVVKSCYLLPSLMHRLESLMLASQLREEISRDGRVLTISCSLILEALTTLRCNESFSMERLELLGDSVLKYAVSCHIFLRYPEKHEGHLSARRSREVSNSNLHELGINLNLQGYIRDSPFDPRRWTAPGQRPTKHASCKHGVDTLEVPLDSKFSTEDAKVKVGEWCDKGHRWMGSKTISDCVEALIGAYYVGGGMTAALQFMKWLGISAEIEASFVEESIKSASLHSWTPKAKDIKSLELKINYEFSVKGLLLEAITHATEHGDDVSYCYQRLEFLGDSALDILITRYLYQNHPDLDPGELTDLRSACVSNVSFAHAAVRHNIYPHLQHGSELLESHISEFVKSVSEACYIAKSRKNAEVPKVLGDLAESIAGAILIDSNFNLDKLWDIFEPLLSPLVTPEKLELPPLRALIELCDSLGYFIKESCERKGDQVHAVLKLQLKDVLLVGEGYGQSRKAAKGKAALSLLKELEDRGISNSKIRKQETGCITVSSSPGSNGYLPVKPNDGNSDLVSYNKQKTFKLCPSSGEGLSDGSPGDCSSDKSEIPVLPPIELRKGGPRQSLFDLCRQHQWPMPTFQTNECKSRCPIEFFNGAEKITGFNSFESQITLTIPGVGVVELTGDPRPDKKSSYDSAALLLLHELEHWGKVIIAKS